MKHSVETNKKAERNLNEIKDLSGFNSTFNGHYFRPNILCDLPTPCNSKEKGLGAHSDNSKPIYVLISYQFFPVCILLLKQPIQS